MGNNSCTIYKKTKLIGNPLGLYVIYIASCIPSETIIFLTGRIFGLTKEHRQSAIVTDDTFSPNTKSPFAPTPSSTGKRKRVDRWSQRAGPQTPTKSAVRSQTESLSITHQFQESPEIIAPDDHDEEATQIT
jgi:hypothetical protein